MTSTVKGSALLELHLMTPLVLLSLLSLVLCANKFRVFDGRSVLDSQCLSAVSDGTLCPTVDVNGNVCISILHEPGEDKWGYERAEERWLPVHTVETILISVISMLADPNDESPANVDAAVRDWV